MNSWAVPDPGQARTEEARRLIDQSASESVELVTVSGLELCALDGPRHLLFDEQVTTAWGALPDAARVAANQAAAGSLSNRGLLLAQAPTGPGFETYALKPELGLVLAAKTRATFAVLAQIERTDARPIKMYAVGDEEQPLQALVVEFPQGVPQGNYPHIRKMGPLGWFYRYILASPQTGAGLLASWAVLAPPKGTRGHRDPVRTVSVFWHRAGEDLHGLVVTVRGDGRTARVIREGQPDPGLVYDETGLRQVMSDLFAIGHR